jgi:hypothetical protein
MSPKTQDEPRSRQYRVGISAFASETIRPGSQPELKVPQTYGFVLLGTWLLCG